ncbi:hypothetical protein F751_1288 [Auxenochlorella protothecoides]|uniref:SBP-type domain-containing protein n=1 Tax=Auxenochlorella protothecoides TaxID=3075 RepID=A0A087SN11_AUXPR|nr:hypothetical protein F751_1288 [Auxenochlorella protothecoides]KFM27115.1 hypothetical protein F751_1288 [Auxenochlorella protothecoides]
MATAQAEKPCGRFQELAAFEGLMRTCRARLDKHAARRRRANQLPHANPDPDYRLPKSQRITYSALTAPSSGGSPDRRPPLSAEGAVRDEGDAVEVRMATAAAREASDTIPPLVISRPLHIQLTTAGQEAPAEVPDPAPFQPWQSARQEVPKDELYLSAISRLAQMAAGHGSTHAKEVAAAELAAHGVEASEGHGSHPTAVPYLDSQALHRPLSSLDQLVRRLRRERSWGAAREGSTPSGTSQHLAAGEIGGRGPHRSWPFPSYHQQPPQQQQRVGSGPGSEPQPVRGFQRILSMQGSSDPARNPMPSPFKNPEVQVGTLGRGADSRPGPARRSSDGSPHAPTSLRSRVGAALGESLSALEGWLSVLAVLGPEDSAAVLSTLPRGLVGRVSALLSSLAPQGTLREENQPHGVHADDAGPGPQHEAGAAKAPRMASQPSLRASETSAFAPLAPLGGSPPHG